MNHISYLGTRARIAHIDTDIENKLSINLYKWYDDKDGEKEPKSRIERKKKREKNEDIIHVTFQYTHKNSYSWANRKNSKF